MRRDTFTLFFTERSSFQTKERGSELTRRTTMQLTYMGNVYTRQSVAVVKPTVALVYRHASYQARHADAQAASAGLTYRGVHYQRSF